MRLRLAPLFVCLLVLLSAASAFAAPFTPGNLVIYRAGDGTAALASSGTAVFLDEYTPAGVFVQSIPMPTTTVASNRRLVCSGTATTEGLINRSTDGQYIVATGYDAAPATASITTSTSATVPRVIARVSAAGTIDTTTALTDGISGGNPRGAASTNGTDLWISGTSSAGGVRYATLGATTSTVLATTPNNLRALGIFGGQLYGSSGAGTVHMFTVGTGTPTTSGQTLTTLPGFPTTGAQSGFFFADLDAGVAGVDTLYVADDTAGTISKFSLVAGSWTANGTKALSTVRGMTGSVSGSNVTLYVTNNTTLQTLTDTSGYNATIAGTLSSIVTAASNTGFRGVAFAPQASGSPDLTIGVTAPATAATNFPFDYTITVNNAGTANATAVSAQFTLPSGVNYTTASGTNGFSASQAAGVVTFSGGSINAGASATLTVTVTPPAAATVTAPVGAAVADPANTIAETNEANNSTPAAAVTNVVDPPTVSSIVRNNATPTNAASVDFTVTFSQSVTGVDASDFAVNSSGLTGASVLGVSGSGTTYVVTAGTGSGDGLLQLNLSDNDSIVSGSIPLGGPGANNGNFTGPSYTVDKTVPTVASIVRTGPAVTNASSIGYTVTFSENVTGVDAGDFDLTTTGLAGTSISGVTGSGSIYTVSVSTGSGDGTIRLDVADNDSIADGAGNPLGGTGAGNGSFTSGQVTTIDRTAPSVSSITRVSASPTAAASVDFTVTFSEPVTGVDSGDFALTTTGVTGTSVTGVVGSGTTYTVSVNTGSGNGTIRLDVSDNDTIVDAATNPLGGTGNNNGDFTAGQVYTIDRSNPAVLSIARASVNPTNASSVNYTVTFSTPVTGVDASDFAITQSGVSGASVSGVSGSGTVYTITVSTGSGDGTLRLDLVDDDSIINGTSIPLGGAGSGNGNFQGEVYTVDKSAPTVSSINRAAASPTNAQNLSFTVTFNEPVTGVDAGDFTVAASGVTVVGVSGVGGSGTTYTVTVNSGTLPESGTVGLNLTDNDSVVDAAGNPLGGTGAGNGNFTGQLYTIDRVVPTVVSINRSAASPTSAASVGYTVTFSEAVTGVDSSDFTLTTTGLTGTSITGVTGSGTTYNVTINTGSGDGTVALNLVDNDSIVDATSNPLGGSGAGNGNASGTAYSVDHTAPTVLSINRDTAATTGLATVSYTVTFSEAVTGVDSSDFTVVSSGLTGASISGVSGSGATYTVTASTGTGNGTLHVDLVDNDSIVDAVSQPLGGAGAGNGNFTGQTYTVDKTAPTVVSINRAGSSPTNAATVAFTVTFSKVVTGVDGSDFAAVATGLSGSSVAGVTGSGTTYTVTLNSGTGNGTLGLNLVDDDTIIDAASNPLGGAGAGNGNFTGQAYTINRGAANHLVLSQVYGGGGNGGSVYKNDFIELFNPTNAVVDLTGWSVQYNGATTTTSGWQVTPLSGSIAPGHYYLVQESQGAGGTTNLPTSDATPGGILMSATAGKVALVNTTTAFAVQCPSGISVIDVVGYGPTANCSETAPTAAPSNANSVIRASGGCTDTDNNSTDFTSVLAAPRNSATAPWSCGQIVGTGSASTSSVGASSTTLLTVAVSPASGPTSTGITAVADLTSIGGSATQTLFDNGTNGDVTAGDNVFSYNAVVGGATTGGTKTIIVSLADAQARTSATSITLTVVPATPPTGVGQANPPSVPAGGSTQLTVTVTLGQNPPSTGVSVTADLTSIGGSATQTLFDNGTNGDVTASDNVFSYNATVDIGTSLGGKTLPVTITDAQARASAASIGLTVQSSSAPPAPTNLVATPGNATVGLSWNPSSGATGYNLKRATISGGPYTIIANNIAATVYTDNAVFNGTQYFYVVSALNGAFESGDSSQVSATPTAPLPSGSLAKIYFVDIGQGAGTLIVGPTGKSLLVDGGPTGQGTAKVIPLLNTLGISHVDYTVVTHYHIDHDDGMTEVINGGKLNASSLAYDNGDDPTTIPPNAGSTFTAYNNYKNALSSHGVPRQTITPGTVIDLGGGMKATCLAAHGLLLSGGSVYMSNQDLNSESISLLVEYNNFDYLVSGDLTGGGSTSTANTPDVETYAAQLAGDVDVVQLDHHGSTTANNHRFLSALKAEVSFASAGYTNTFGHPNRETVNKFLNTPTTISNTYPGTGIPPSGTGPVFYQTDPSPNGDTRCTLQGYSGASPANAGQGTILVKTDGTTSFTLESFDDGGVRLPAAAHAYALDATGAGVTTNFPPTVVPALFPAVPLATDVVTVRAQVADREDPISSVTLNYSLNGVAQAPVTMTLTSGLWQGTIPAQADATRVDVSVSAVAGGQTTTANIGYFAGITPIATLRQLSPLGEPLWLDYFARVSGVCLSGTGNYSTGSNDDYLQDNSGTATVSGAINIWRTIQPASPAPQPTSTGASYTIAGVVGENLGRFRLEVSPPFEGIATTYTPTTTNNPTPYTVTQTGTPGAPAPTVKTIAQINANPEALEGQLIQINGASVTSGTIPATDTGIDSFITISDGTGTLQLKVDHDSDLPGFATPSGSFTCIGIIQQDDALRPFDALYDITPRTRADLGGTSSGPALRTIAEARADLDPSTLTSPGDYVPDLLGQTVKVRGVVTSIDFRSGAGIEYYIQDPTAGVDIFNTSVTNAWNIGDNVEVIGTVSQFNGLTELNPGTAAGNLTLLPPGTLPAVVQQVVTLSQLGDSGAGENFEGSLVRVNNVTLSAPPATFAGNTNYVVTDSTGTGTIRISPASNLVGTVPPSGPFSLNALVGQFDSASPFDSGYQMFPRSTSDLLPPAATPASITAQNGTPQSAPVNSAFPTAFTAIVRDASSNPIAGVAVTFSAPGSGASGTFGGSTTVMTDAGGVATAPTFTANATTGSYNVTATINSLTATFSLTNTAAAPVPTNLVAQNGTPQSTQVNTAFATALTALVTDASSAPMAGVSVTFTAPASGASGTFGGSATVMTNASGVATAPTFTANGTAGSYTVTATVNALTATYSLTNTAAPVATSLTTFAGSGQTATVATAFGTALQVKATDGSSNPVSGVSVTFTAPGSGASGTFTGSATVITDVNGIATAPTFTANQTAGSYNVTATAGALNTTLALTNTAGAAANLVTVAGTPQSAVINTAFATALQAKVTDSFSNPVAGASVTFIPPGSGASGTFSGSATVTTDALGVATAPTFTANGTVGGYSVQAQTSGGALTTSFALNNVADPNAPANLTIVAGSPQSAQINTAFATALQVKVTNISSAPLSGVSVTFTPPGSGASGTFSGSATVVTDVNGIATAPALTANGTAGNWSATATAGSLSVSLPLTNTTLPPPPATHFSVTGPAVTQPGVPFTLTVTALDAANAVVTGYTGTVSFSSSSAATLPANYTFVAGDNGTHSFSVTLNTQGPQTISVTDGSISGSYNVTIICPPALPATVIISAHAGVCANSAGNTASVVAVASTYLWAITNGTITSGQGTHAIIFTAGPTGTVGLTVGLSNSFGCAVGVGSANIPISTAPTASIAAGGTIQACAGSTVGIPVTLTGTAPFTIVWSDGLTQSGITTNTFSRSIVATVSRTYSIVSVSDAGCGTGAGGGGVSVVVNTAPVITQQPASASQHAGERANLSVVATGTGLSYEWYEGEVGDQSHMVGTGPTLTSLPLGRSTKFWVRIFNGCGIVQSNAAVITIQTGRPRIATH